MRQIQSQSVERASQFQIWKERAETLIRLVPTSRFGGMFEADDPKPTYFPPWFGCKPSGLREARETHPERRVKSRRPSPSKSTAALPALSPSSPHKHASPETTPTQTEGQSRSRRCWCQASKGV